MDPTASFVITGRDASGAAFASADRNLKSFTRGFMQFRSALAGFGVVLSGRALVSWMSRAVETTEAIGDQRLAVLEAQRAFESYRRTSDQLAESFAVRATPAIKAFAEVLESFRASVDPTKLDIYNQRVANLRTEIEALEAELSKRVANEDKTFLWFFSANGPYSEQAIASINQRLAQLRMNLVALEAAAPKNTIADGLQEITAAIVKMPAGLKSFDFAAASAAVLNSELQEVSATIAKMPADLQKLSPEFNTLAASLREPLKEIEDDAKETAEFIGASFRHAFSDWLVDGELQFKDFLKRIAAELATSALFSGLGSLFPAGGFLSNLFGGFRADGGQVQRGKFYKVGEKGEEWFAPGMSGTIIPAGAGGGASFRFETNIDARGADPSLAARLPGILAANNQRLKAEIQDLKRRGRL